jgi:insulysin
MLSVNHLYFKTPYVYDSAILMKNIKTTEEYRNKFKKYFNQKDVIKIISSREYMNPIKYNVLEYYDAKYSEIPNLVDIQQINIVNNFGFNNLDNPYIDIKIKLIENLDSMKIPKLIHTRQWVGECSEYGEPSVFIMLQLYNLKFYNSPTNYLLSSISCSVFNFLVNTILYDAIEVGYSIYFEPKPYSSTIHLTIQGINDMDKLKLLFEEIYDILHNLEKYIGIISDSYIHNLIISLKRAYMNTKFMNPAEYSSHIIRNKIYNTEYSNDILLDNIDNISYDMVVNFMKTILNDTALTTFVYGNIVENNIFNKYKKLFKIKLDDIPHTNKIENLSIQHPNMNEKSNCITYYYYIGDYSYKKILLISLASKIIGNEFFEILRTKQQLGYLVSMGSTTIMKKCYMVQKIQSDRPIEEVEEKIRQFNNMIPNIIEKANFEQFVETLVNDLNEKDKSMNDRINRYLPEITNREYIFDRNDRLLKYVKKINKQHFIDFVNQNITNDRIIKLIVKGN